MNITKENPRYAAGTEVAIQYSPNHIFSRESHVSHNRVGVVKDESDNGEAVCVSLDDTGGIQHVLCPQVWFHHSAVKPLTNK